MRVKYHLVRKRTKEGEIMSLLQDIQVLKKIIDNPLNKIAKETNLTVNEIRVILFLYENEKLDLASEIVEKLMISKAHVSVSVESLVKKKYIKKVQDDRNKKKFHLKLIDRSKEVIDLLDIEIEKLKNTLMRDVSLQDREIFINTLKTIIKNTKAIA